MVRQRSAKPRFPSSNLGGASKNKKHCISSAFSFLERCVPQAERDVHFVSDVCFASDVRFAREDAEHTTSLCDEGAIHHCAMGHNITFAQAKTPLSSRQAVAYRLVGKLMRKSKDCNRYYLSFTKNLLYASTA